MSATWTQTTRLIAAVLCAAALGSPHASALQVVASDDMDNALNRTSYTISVDATAWPIRDWFGIGNVATFPHPDGVPGGLADDTVVDISGGGIFSTDDVGFIDGLRDPNDSFFSATDTVNGLNTGDVWAEWVFDISGVNNLSVAIDIAAMGKFEQVNDPGPPLPDRFDLTYAVDGGAFSPLFTSSVDDGGTQNYTMQNGNPITHGDPLLMDDGTGPVKLSDVFTTFTRAIPETGSSLTLRVEAYIDHGGEAVALDNIVITGDVVGAAPGDYDSDGDVDDADIDLYIGKLGTAVPPTDDKFDLVDDDVVDVNDYNQHATTLMAWSNAVVGQSGAGTLLGDYNRDGEVTLLDLNTLGTGFGGAGGWADGDTNGDGDVTLLDLNTLGMTFGQSVLANPAIPEPGGLILYGLSIVSLVCRRRRDSGKTKR